MVIGPPGETVVVESEVITGGGGGFSVTVAEADLVVSAALVAVTVTAC